MTDKQVPQNKVLTWKEEGAEIPLEHRGAALKPTLQIKRQGPPSGLKTARVSAKANDTESYDPRAQHTMPQSATCENIHTSH